ncbi:MAG: methyltransferase domain-containing protein [Paludisphaera borealis]|uniref:class I SAM-dependent methyltransferase n=1 Tax=Paludisphaera borealis TaxID=1387353 RepID=UPI00283ECAC9|nr:methyltransferase domain-containing protein [Paludisphaera borealis]MDR3621291.1 methyltransferase domain-containing protein [Paludisphaera borealis]
MNRTRTITGLLAVAVACLAMALIGPSAVSQTAPSRTKQAEPPKGKVDPRINAQFEKPDVKAWIERFESENREVFARRAEIVTALNLKPGMAVADLGAGTGLFTRLMADKVGAEGRVYAVDVSPGFLKHIAEQSRKLGQKQVTTVQGTQLATNLAPGTVDLVFICDVYHHLEDPEPVLASIRQALRPGGALVLIEFDRVKGKSTDFVLKHVRADKKQFFHEIEQAGFTLDPSQPKVKLAENFFARFRKDDRPPPTPAPGKSRRPDRGPRS